MGILANALSFDKSSLYFSYLDTGEVNGILVKTQLIESILIFINPPLLFLVSTFASLLHVSIFLMMILTYTRHHKQRTYTYEKQ